MSRNVEDLHPLFQPIVKEVAKRALERGMLPYITQGKREPAYQACLYAQGRARVGTPFYIDGFEVTAKLLTSGKLVVVKCRGQENLVTPQDWTRKVTNAGPFDSFHTLGFATDWTFRSSPTAKDDVVSDLGKKEREAKDKRLFSLAAQHRLKVHQLYRAFAEVWREVEPAAVWGFNWRPLGQTLEPQDVRIVDQPHFEWHPGKTLAQIKAGELPSSPKQCGACRNFRGAIITNGRGERCMKCHEGKR